MLKSKDGFSLAELAITLVITSVLIFIGSTVYKANEHKAVIAEGLQLISTIKEQEDLRMAFNDSGDLSKNFVAIPETDFYVFQQDSFTIATIEIDARINKYFRKFQVRVDPSEGSYVAEAYYDAKATVILSGSDSSPYVLETIWK
ncbi:MAG: prepilin-type N-terminal cleavage/methylation domain-containing protein [Endomicrobium sp.]|jgi:prepilin-type N-terminal cleavage/methylation domain-containing protein|nr:prepilin-type N-terminal cleavage/methylation domain-containing protein [Endomicrobium sp.]